MMSWITIWCSVAVILGRPTGISCVAPDGFLPYGAEHGDSSLGGASATASLDESFTYLGETYSTVTVNMDGSLFWGPISAGMKRDTSSASAPVQNVSLVAPFFGDADLTSGGDVFYRSTSSPELLQRVSDIVAAASFEGLAEELPLRSLFIATWHRVPASGGPVDQHNTFQCVLAYNTPSSSSESQESQEVTEPMSFVLFLYEDGGMQWSRGQGEDSQHALVGLSNGNDHHLILPTSRTESILEVAATGNTGVAGQWLFRVDGPQVQLPAPIVGLEQTRYSPILESVGSLQVCVQIHAGEPSREFSVLLRVNEQDTATLTFQPAGLSRQCVDVPIVDDRVVEYSETLTMVVSTDDPYPTILPSTAVVSIVDNDVTVGWEYEQYSVLESVRTVELCAILDAVLLSQDVVVHVHTEEVNAEASFGRTRKDYVAVTTQLRFRQSGSTRLCTSVSIESDSIVEYNETLTVALASTDEGISILTPTATVTILDDDFVTVTVFDRYLLAREQDPVRLICMSITGSMERSVDINFKFTDGSAIAGVHYGNVSRAVHVEPGSGTRYPCITLPIINNDVYDVGGREFYVMLVSSDQSVRFMDTSVTIHILDDDADGVLINFPDREYTVSEEDESVTVCAHLSRGQIAAGKHIDIKITTNTDTFIGVHTTPAYLNVDYDEAERVVRFDSAERGPLCLDVPIVRDDILEDTESFTIELMKVDPELNFQLNPSTVRVVLNDHNSVTATMEHSVVMVEEASRTVAEICVLIHDLREIDLVMIASPSPDNATANVDYDNTQKEFTLLRSDSRACTSIRIINDYKLEELYETFHVDVRALHPRVFFNQSRTSVIIVDQDVLILRPFDSPELSSVVEASSTGRFCAITTGELDIEVMIRFHTEDATAVAGEDYVPFDHLEVLGPQNISSEGTSQFCTPFFPVDDIIVEGTESFFVVMSPISDRVKPYQPGKDRIEVHIKDDDVVHVIPASPEVSVREGDGHVTLCATMIGLTERPIDISLTAVDGTAEEGIDYQLDGSYIHFPSYLDTYGHLDSALVAQFAVNPPRTDACANITILDDTLLERVTSKQFTVHFGSLSLPSERLRIESAITVTILEDDNIVVALDQVPLTVNEQARRARVRLTLEGEADYSITVSVHTRPTAGDNAATPDEDYTAVVDTVEIPAHYRETSLLTNELTIPIRDDNLLEDLEVFEVVLESDSPGVILGEPHVGAIWIEDIDFVLVKLEDAEFRVLESAGFASVCCELGGATGKVISINITSSSGTAQDGIDYLAPPSQFLFQPSSATYQKQCIDFQLFDDAVLEAVESFFVTISTDVPRVIVGRNTSKVSLVDDDGVYVSLVTGEHRVEEEAERREVEVCVQLTGVIEREVEVTLFTKEDTAHANADFVNASRLIVFPISPDGNQTRCTTFYYLDDTIVEETERFDILLMTVSDDRVDIVTNRAKVLIIDSDRVSVDLEHFSYSVSEGDGEMSVCVELGAAVERSIIVQVASSEETAKHYSDFTHTDTLVTFQPRGATRMCTAIGILDDQLLEDEEHFVAHLFISDPALYIASNAASGNSSAEVAIGDNDMVRVSLESSEYTVNESIGQLSVCSKLSGATGKSISVMLTSQPGTARAEFDYTAPPSEFLFQPSVEPRQTECVEVFLVNDDILEDVETFHLEISTAVPRVDVSLSTAVVIMMDDDDVYVSLVSSEYSVEEEAERREVEVCVQLTGVIEREVEVTLFTEEDTAHADVDFTSSTHFIEFSPSSAGQQTICSVFAVLDDAIVESSETFFVKLTASDEFIVINISEALVSILDSDNVSIDFERSAYLVSEGEGEVSVCVELGAEVERSITVRLTTSPDTAEQYSDYTPTDTQLSFQPRGTTRACTAIPVEDDAIFEDEEYFTLSLLTVDSALYTNSSGRNSSVVVSIADNDNVYVTLVAGEHRVEEEHGEVEMCVQLTGVLERKVEITLFTEEDTAHADADYVTATHSILFSSSLLASQTNCTAFTIINDDTVENVESFVVRLTMGDDDRIIAINNSAIVFINDADLVDIDFDRSMYSVSEREGEVSICVELGAVVERSIIVRVTTSPDTAEQYSDYTPTDTQLSFQPRGTTHQCTAIPIIDNNVLEYEEQFFVYVFNTDRSRITDHGYEEEFGSGEVIVIGEGVQSVVVVGDDDSVRVGVEQDQYEVEESERDVRVCIVLEGEMDRHVSVTVETVIGTARAGLDYFHVSQVMNFEPRNQAVGVVGGEEDKRCVRVQLVDDSVVERNEEFSVRLTSPLENTAIQLSPKSASIRIIDEDVVCVSDLTTSPRGDYLWRQTRPGLVELPCQHGQEGATARRRCDQNGNWEEEDVKDCYGETEDLFPWLEKLPFDCENFHELLRTVTQTTEERDYNPYYLAIVARYFNDFADITKDEGYIVEKQTCLSEEAFSIGVMIIDQLHHWPRDILWTNSTSIIRSFEVISEEVVANPESADINIPLENIAFSSVMDEKKTLEETGVTREFSSTGKNAPLKIETETSTEDSPDSGTVLGSIHLPPALFLALSEELTEVGVWFSLHKRGSFFPLPDDATVNDSVSTPVISATVGGHAVHGLLEPVLFSLQLLNRSVTDTKCASWDHDQEDWTVSGCETVSVKDGYVTCSCTHLTNFAGVGEALVRTAAIAPPEPPSLTLSIIALVGIMLGLMALILTLFILLAFGKLRRRRTTILRAQLCVSLLLLLLAYAAHVILDYTAMLPQDIPIPCVVISVFTHYFTLTSLVWVGTEALLMFRKLVFAQRLGDLSNLFFVAVSVTSWLVPFPFSAIPAVLNQDWMVTEDEYCFVSSFPVLVGTFLVPIAIILVFNLFVYLTVMSLFLKYSCRKPQQHHQQQQQQQPTKRKRHNKSSRRKATTRLLLSTPVIGTFFIVAWAFGALTFLTSEASLPFYLISAFFSALLGWFLFVYYVLTAKDTKKLLHDACCRKEKPLKTHEFMSMESLGKASGIDESDSDSDYPERERRYGEFDVTFIGRKSALIEQKFSIGFMADGASNDNNNHNNNNNNNNNNVGSMQSAGGIVSFSAYTPPPLDRSTPAAVETPSATPKLNRTHVDSVHHHDHQEEEEEVKGEEGVVVVAIAERPKQRAVSGESLASRSSDDSQVDSDEPLVTQTTITIDDASSPRAGAMGNNLPQPAGLAASTAPTVTPDT